MSLFRRAVEIVESGERKQQILQPVQTGMNEKLHTAIPTNTLCSWANQGKGLEHKIHKVQETLK